MGSLPVVVCRSTRGRPLWLFFRRIGSRVSSCAPYQFGVFQFDDLLGIVSVQLNAFFVSLFLLALSTLTGAIRTSPVATQKCCVCLQGKHLEALYLVGQC